MAYCDLADLIDAKPEAVLIQLTDDAGDEEIDAGVAAEAIASADAEIDSYVGVRYAVPLSPAPKVIRDASVVLTLYRLYSRRQGPPQDIGERREQVVAWLRDVAGGKATLGEGDPGGTPPAGRVEISSSPRIFSRDSLKVF